MLLVTVSRSIEPLEQAWQFVGINARSIVRNRHDNRIAPSLGGDVHFTLTVHLRIGDQVVEHNLDAPAVDVDQRQVIGYPYRDRDVRGTELLDALHHEALYTGGSTLEQEKTSFLAREAEQVTDKSGQLIGFTANRLKKMALVRE
jgi:hypothetical protein